MTVRYDERSLFTSGVKRMVFFEQNGAVIILVALTILLQCAGMIALIQWIKAQFPNGIHRLGAVRSFLLVVRFTSLLICLHVLEILLWAWFYRLRLLANWEAAFYFSAADYSTVGAGDIVLRPMWRMMGPIESVTGVLMCGLSAGFLFALVTRMIVLEDPAIATPCAESPRVELDSVSFGTGAERES